MGHYELNKEIEYSDSQSQQQEEEDEIKQALDILSSVKRLKDVMFIAHS